MIVVVGLSHKTAPIAVREKIALPKGEIVHALEQIVARPTVGEAMLVSTCNRVELVVAGKRGETPALDDLAQDAVEALSSIAPAVVGHLYVHRGSEGVRHLFRVASSLDSLVLGEPQILGQVKEAFEIAKRAETVGACLHRTVPRAIRAAKRVRTETGVGSGQVSVPSIAVDLAKRIFGELEGRNVVLIGSGEMAEAVAKLLHNAGTRLCVVGRNEARVSVLAASVGGEPRAWSALEQSLIEADVVITSTSAPGFVVSYETLKKCRKKRRGRSLFCIDLAVPRDIDPRIESLGEVFLYNVDDLERVVSETFSNRKRESEAAEALVVEEMRGWERWAESLQVTPIVVAMRARVGEVLAGELEKSLRGRLRNLGVDEREALALMVEATVNKLLHAPTTHLREAATDRLRIDTIDRARFGPHGAVRARPTIGQRRGAPRDRRGWGFTPRFAARYGYQRGMTKLVVATRKSQLALAQARAWMKTLRDLHPGIEIEELHVTTTGDRVQDRSLAEIGGKGLFIKEIEESLDRRTRGSRRPLLERRARGAARRAHDRLHPEARGPARRAGHEDGRRARGSTRRQSSRDFVTEAGRAADARTDPDLVIVPLSGNVDTRLRKCAEGEVDAAVLALAGLVRLGLADRASEILDPKVCLPAIGQGALGIEHRVDDARHEGLLEPA